MQPSPTVQTPQQSDWQAYPEQKTLNVKLDSILLLVHKSTLSTFRTELVSLKVKFTFPLPECIFW